MCVIYGTVGYLNGTHLLSIYIFFLFFYCSIPLWIIASRTFKSQYVKCTFFKFFFERTFCTYRTFRNTPQDIRAHTRTRVRIERLERRIFVQNTRTHAHTRTYRTFRNTPQYTTVYHKTHDTHTRPNGSVRLERMVRRIVGTGWVVRWQFGYVIQDSWWANGDVCGRIWTCVVVGCGNTYRCLSICRYMDGW